MILLDNKTFYQKYSLLIDETKKESFKLEVLQTYVEDGISDWNSLNGKKLSKLLPKAQKEILKQKKEFDDCFKKGVKIKRVRYIHFPLDKYLIYELSSFQAAVDIGEDIDVIEGEKKTINIDITYFKDFLLFDKRKILVHNYIDGKLCGAFFSEDPTEVAPYLEVRKQVLKSAIPLNDFLNQLSVSFKKYY
jgi:hypothetical protein